MSRDFRKMALNFIAKAPVSFLRFTQPRLATFGRYAKVWVFDAIFAMKGLVKLNLLS